ncbi:MAG TPA: Ldh family oxidoreductase [Albitalea sp.]|uniref:Ldh family oxidoreductase n=1 Tax=Piscinibacter sp. TaxID=1903157 RepID=UPI002ED059E1
MGTEHTDPRSWHRFDAAALQGFAEALLGRAGLAQERARVVADVLVEADLMGHTTHGLQLLASYLRDIDNGRMSVDGEPEVLHDYPGAVTWDGRYLPGPWLVRQAMALAFERVASQAVVTVAIRHSHHIACLAAYLKQATDRGLVMLLSCSDPATGSVAPHGAIAGRYTPNPLAAGFPTGGEPILIDISASTTTNGMTGRMNRDGRGERLPGPWLVDNRGEASDDPRVMLADPPGAILPLGGMELGHKGFGLGLLVEALTSGLAGASRGDAPRRWGASVFLQVLDPQAFGGRDRFEASIGWLAESCRGAPVKPGNPAVRLPGQRALALREQQRTSGVALHPEIMPALAGFAERSGIVAPRPRF